MGAPFPPDPPHSPHLPSCPTCKSRCRQPYAECHVKDCLVCAAFKATWSGEAPNTTASCEFCRMAGVQCVNHSVAYWEKKAQAAEYELEQLGEELEQAKRTAKEEHTLRLAAQATAEGWRANAVAMEGAVNAMSEKNNRARAALAEIIRVKNLKEPTFEEIRAAYDNAEAALKEAK